MNIKVILRGKKKVAIDYLEFTTVDGTTALILEFNETHFKPTEVFGKYVYAYKSLYRNGKEILAERCDLSALDELKFLQLTALRAFDLSEKKELDWLDIESIQIYDGEDVYDVPPSLFCRFRSHNIHTDSIDLTLTEDQYQAIAQYVRLHDKMENLDNALSVCLDSFAGYDNVCSYLKKELVFDPGRMTEEFNVDDYTGEEEVAAVNHIIHVYGGMAVYTLISNADTPDECSSDVILMKQQADILSESIRERNNGGSIPFLEGEVFLIDRDGDSVDLFYVDEIRFKTDISEF